jgi:hypothetical protein
VTYTSEILTRSGGIVWWKECRSIVERIDNTKRREKECIARSII